MDTTLELFGAVFGFLNFKVRPCELFIFLSFPTLRLLFTYFSNADPLVHHPHKAQFQNVETVRQQQSHSLL